jgi:hypothetical protein
MSTPAAPLITALPLSSCSRNWAIWAGAANVWSDEYLGVLGGRPGR